MLTNSFLMLLNIALTSGLLFTRTGGGCKYKNKKKLKKGAANGITKHHKEHLCLDEGEYINCSGGRAYADYYALAAREQQSDRARSASPRSRKEGGSK